MKKNFLSIIFCMMLYASSAYSYNIDLNITTDSNGNISDVETINKLKFYINKGWELYRNKDYNESLQIFNDLCTKYRILYGCVGKAVQIRDGLGIQKDLKGAEMMFREIMNKGIDGSKDEAAWELAYTLEYYNPNNKDQIDEAMDLYEETSKSDNELVAKAAKNGLARKMLYDFLRNFFDIEYKVFNDKISGKQYADALNNLNTYYLPDNIKAVFNEYKKDMSEVKIWDDERISKGLSLIGKSIIKPLMGDFSIFADAGSAFIDIRSIDKTYERAKDNYNKLYNLFINYGISSDWMNKKRNKEI